MVRTLNFCSAVAGVGVVLLSSAAFAAAPQSAAQATDVSTLTSQLQNAVSGCSSKTDVASVQGCMSVALANSGYDAVTGQAALSGLANGTTVEGQAATALLAQITPLAQQEVNQANATGVAGSGSSGAAAGGGGFAGGTAGGGGGGGGYVVGH